MAKLRVFHQASPGEKASPGQIFFEDLVEKHIKPALIDFDRYIYWHTKVEEDAEAKWKVTFKPMRNNGEAFPPDSGLFRGEYTISVSSKEAAREFAHTLELNMLREQNLFNRNRPVEKFGETSKNLAIRESLRAAIKTHQEDIDLKGNNLLAQLHRDRRPDGP